MLICQLNPLDAAVSEDCPQAGEDCVYFLTIALRSTAEKFRLDVALSNCRSGHPDSHCGAGQPEIFHS
jgi:hypothetical protein